MSDKPAFATVATTGSYADLSNTPIIPAALSTMVSLATVGTNLTWSKPAGITRIKVTVVGAGAGGNGQSNNAGAGGASVFDTAGINVTGGGGGRPSTLNTRGAGGTATNGDVNIAGAPGMTGIGSNAGGPGLGAYGAGGHGAYLTSSGVAGGGAGGMAIRYMTVPSAVTNYSYTIGAGGAASGSQATLAPIAGSQGIILIEY